jgi:hypothetical protein
MSLADSHEAHSTRKSCLEGEALHSCQAGHLGNETYLSYAPEDFRIPSHRLWNWPLRLLRP